MIFVLDLIINLMEGEKMSAPENIKFDLYEQFKQESQSSFYAKIDVAFDAGVATVPPSGGKSDEEVKLIVDQAKAELKASILGVIPAVVDGHDADTQNDDVLKANLVSAIESL